VLVGSVLAAAIPRRCSTMPPALPHTPPHGGFAFRAALRLAISLRPVGSVVSCVPSEVTRSPRKVRLVASLRSPLGAACRLAVSASLRLAALRPACAPPAPRGCDCAGLGASVEMIVDRNGGGGIGALGESAAHSIQ
jgi:hypothetical protein